MQVDPERDILPFLDSDVHARRLLQHPWRQTMRFAGGGFHVLDVARKTLIRLSGITRMLREAYWPSYMSGGRMRAPGLDTAHQKQKHRARASALHQLLKRTAAKRARAAANKRARLDALHARQQQRVGGASGASAGGGTGAGFQAAAKAHVRGSIVHAQIGDYLRHDAAGFATRHPEGLHPWARRLLVTLAEQDMTPLCTDYGVLNMDLKLGTEIDLVCVRSSGELVLVEIKTTQSRALFYHDDPSTPMVGLLKQLGLPGSAYGRAVAQLLVGVFLGLQGGCFGGDFETYLAIVSPDRIELKEVRRDKLFAWGIPLWRDLQSVVPALIRQRLTEARAKRAASGATTGTGTVTTHRQRRAEMD